MPEVFLTLVRGFFFFFLQCVEAIVETHFSQSAEKGWQGILSNNWEIFSNPWQGSGNFVKEEEERLSDAGGWEGAVGNAIFWILRASCTYVLPVAVITWTNPAQKQAS